MTIVEDDEEMHTDAVDAVEETVYLAIQDKNHNVKEINIMLSMPFLEEILKKSPFNSQ